LIHEAPHDRDDHRWYGPRHQRERPREPQEVRPLLEQDREAQAEDVLEERRRERPDDPDLEGLPEQVVAEEARVVVEEGRREIDVEASLRVGETEIDALDQRQHAEEDDRDERGQQEDQRTGAHAAQLLAAARGDGGGHADASRGPPLDSRITRYGATVRWRGASVGSLRRSSSRLAARRARSAEPSETLLSAGVLMRASSVSSIPTTATSCGTRSCRSASARIAPTAMRSSAQKSASGRARASSRRAAPNPAAYVNSPPSTSRRS